MSTQTFIAQHPICCFCGGQTATATVDHQPARIIFPDKHRPKGMEFPACAVCNAQTSGDEALLALVCRFAGSSRINAAGDYHRLKDIVRSVEMTSPGLMLRMRGQRIWNQQRGVWIRAGAVNVNQPEIHLSLCRVAAKLVLATYYDIKGAAASEDCRINVQWTHAQNRDAFANVQNIIAMAPQQKVLTQGKWETSDSFFLKYHEENGQLFCLAVFHQSVALLAQLREPQVQNHWEKWQFVVAPKSNVGIVPI